MSTQTLKKTAETRLAAAGTVAPGEAPIAGAVEPVVARTLKEQAVGLDACQQALREWTSDPDGLCELYIRYLDFCMEHDYPSNAFMKAHFDGVLQRHGIFVDEQLDCDGMRQMVCNGSTTGVIRYDDYGVGTVYVRHQSDVKIVVSGAACVVVRVYDRARVQVTNVGTGHVSVLRYGGQVAVKGVVSCPDMSL